MNGYNEDPNNVNGNISTTTIRTQPQPQQSSWKTWANNNKLLLIIIIIVILVIIFYLWKKKKSYR